MTSLVSFLVMFMYRQVVIEHQPIFETVLVQAVTNVLDYISSNI